MLEHTEFCIDKRGETYLKNVLDELTSIVNPGDFEAMLKTMDMKRPQANNRKEELNILTNSVNLVRLKNNPVRLSEEVLKSMYERILI